MDKIVKNFALPFWLGATPGMFMGIHITEWKWWAIVVPTYFMILFAYERR